MDLRSIVKALRQPDSPVPAWPIRARVVAARSAPGLVDAMHPRASVDVQPLTVDGADDPDWPVLPDLELPTHWSGDGRGLLVLPPLGAIVRVSFYYGDRSQPFVDSILAFGTSLPALEQGEMLLASGPTVRVRLRADRVVVEAPRVELASPDVRLSGAAEELVRASLLEWAATHTHPTPSGISSAPVTPPPASARATGVRG